MSYLDIAKKAEQALKKGTTTTEVADPTEGPIVAVLIDSEILGAPIWFALQDDWHPDAGDGRAVFYASELPALRMKTAQQLRDIFRVERTFDGGMVRQ